MRRWDKSPSDSTRRTVAGGARRGRRRGRSAAVDIYLLPSRDRTNAQVALTLRRSLRPDYGGHRERIFNGSPDVGAANRPRKGKDSRRQDSVSSAIPRRFAGAVGRRSRVIYLVFNEGYSASSGESVTRPDLSGEAIRLGRLLVELWPEPEAIGLLALMLLHESRRRARTSPTGELILLENQDRSLWSREHIVEGKKLVERAVESRRFGPYTLQAAISAVHADAKHAAETDWAQIVRLYDLLLQAEPSPVVELNRAVAVAMRDGPAAGLEAIDRILARGDLADYHLAHAARADLCRRLGRKTDARASYQQALSLSRQEPERRFLERRLAEMAEKN